MADPRLVRVLCRPNVVPGPVEAMVNTSRCPAVQGTNVHFIRLGIDV